MDIKSIKNLMNLFESSQLGEMEVESSENGESLRVTLKRNAAPAVVTAMPVTAAAISAPAPAPAPAPVQAAPQLQAETGQNEGVLDYNLVEDIKSPMVGVFYAAPSPESDPFVTRGTKVKKGDTLCIIEAMKLMNEVVAERDGEIVEILPKSGELVEFGQILFKIF